MGFGGSGGGCHHSSRVWVSGKRWKGGGGLDGMGVGVVVLAVGEIMIVWTGSP